MSQWQYGREVSVAEAEGIVARCLEAADRWEEAKGGPFSWPTDFVAQEPWGYVIHCEFVGAWNATGRRDSCVVAFRRWITVENVCASFAKKPWWEGEDLPLCRPPM